MTWYFQWGSEVRIWWTLYCLTRLLQRICERQLSDSTDVDRSHDTDIVAHGTFRLHLYYTHLYCIERTFLNSRKVITYSNELPTLTSSGPSKGLSWPLADRCHNYAILESKYIFLHWQTIQINLNVNECGEKKVWNYFFPVTAQDSC